MPQADSTIRTINRVCDILNCFSSRITRLTLTEISNKVGIPKSTTHRLLEALRSQGFVNYDTHSRKFQLGYQLIRWGTDAQAGVDVRNISLPFLRELTDITGETSILSIRNGYSGFCLEMIESPHPMRLSLRVGQPLPLHAGSSSKILWAFLPEIEIDDILSRIELLRMMDRTITDPILMKDELKTIRERGYARSFEETDKDAMGISAPVYDHQMKLVAGVGVIAPVTRVTDEVETKMIEQVLHTSRMISKLMGAPNQ
ncbi:MAG: IclR family transcriptional regulator [Anaerolineaceae bacterium]|nr:IclR family transcriptional regulator [Anaerolineaceae bacterium]